MVFVQIAQDFALVCKNANIREEFEDNFENWCKAVITYSKKVNTTALQDEIRGFSDESDGGRHE